MEENKSVLFISVHLVEHPFYPFCRTSLLLAILLFAS